jgi:hypothetical protein
MKKITGLLIFFTVICMASCAEIDQAPFEKIINDYFAARSFDMVNDAHSADIYLAGKLVILGLSRKPDYYVIKKNVDIISVMKKNIFIDLDQKVKADAYDVFVQFIPVGQIIENKINFNNGIKKYHIVFIEKDHSYKINSDQSHLDRFILESDVNKFLANRKLAGTPTAKP